VITLRVVRHWHRLPGETVDALLGSVRGQVGQGFEQPGLVEGDTADGGGGGTR